VIAAAFPSSPKHNAVFDVIIAGPRMKSGAEATPRNGRGNTICTSFIALLLPAFVGIFLAPDKRPDARDSFCFWDRQ
jgi:hypothetical protein